VTYHPGRQGKAYWAARKRVLVPGAMCHICRRALDFDAPPRTRWAPSVDHVIPLKTLETYDPVTRRRLSTDPANMLPAHVGCNARRGARSMHAVKRPPAQPTPSDYGDTLERSPDAWRNPHNGSWWSRDWGGGVRNRDWAAHVAAGGMTP